MDIVLNELSLRELPLTAAHAFDLWNQWLALMMSLQREQQATPGLRTVGSLLALPITQDGDVFSQWLTQLSRERRQVALLFTTRSPFLPGAYPEYRFRAEAPAGVFDAACVGFAFAAENHLLAWSYDALGQWTAADYELVRQELDAAGEELLETNMRAWHLPATGLTAKHKPFLDGLLDAEEQRIITASVSGATLVSRWPDWFPALQLTRLAAETLVALESDTVRPVAERLLRMQRFFHSWRGEAVNYERVWAYHTSQESTSRLQQKIVPLLECLDGVTRVMSWHLRYNPREGRLYFVPHSAGEASKCYIGYIGRKIT